MMKCNFCSAEWEGDSTVCPECGMDNAEVAACPETVVDNAEQMQTQEAPKKVGAARIALLVVLAILAIGVVVALVFGSLKDKPEATDPTDESTTATTDPESDASSYTAAEDALIAAHDTVVATMGDKELTNGMLQVYYWNNFYDFMNSYGSYAAYLGLNTAEPLDQQTSPDGGTWQEYFLKNALVVWQQFCSLTQEAEAVGFTLSEENQKLLAAIPEDLKKTATENGYDSVEDLMYYSLGPGATVEDYQQYMHDYQLGFLYFESKREEIKPTDAEIEAYFTEHEASFAEDGLTKDTATVDVRHILIQPESSGTGEDGSATYTDEAWAACEDKANTLLNSWLEGEATEESFAALATTTSQDPGSAQNGGLYEGVEVGQMVEPFENWCFDAARKVGDYGLVKTSYGYHIMYFVQRNSVWMERTRSAMVSELSTKFISDTMAKYPQPVVDHASILLGALPTDPNRVNTSEIG